MALKDILNFFSPKDKTFFPLFEQATHKLTKLSEFLHEAANATKNDRDIYFTKIDELAENIEKTSHTMNLELSKNFITPFDREDIHALTTSIDDIADNINGCATRIQLYNVKQFSKTMELMSEVLLKQIIEIDAAVRDMKNMKNIQRVRESIIRINSLENHADDLFDESIARLFAEASDPLELIKTKEVLSSLEVATDKCEDVANVLESILVKNS